MECDFKAVGIAGLGLIGGSMALAIKENTSARVLGWDISREAVSLAFSAKAIDEVEGDIGQCDILLVALYPGDAVKFVGERAQLLKPGAAVVDLCGIKRFLCRELGAMCSERGLHYIGAHPMAGRETSGFKSANAGLYKGASVILTPSDLNSPEVLTRLEGLLRAVGFGRIIHTTPQRHDEMIAYTSQLAHVLSSAYIQNPLAAAFEGFSAFTGGSYQDLTRVSRLNSEMWGELFLRNSDMLCSQLDLLIEKLIDYKKAIRGGDAEALRELMERGTAIKEQLLGELGNAE